MILKKIRLVVFSIIYLFSTELSAQQQYKAEIGVLGGGAFYLGDANSQLFKNMQLAYGGFFRYKINPRVSFKIELASTSVNGTFGNSYSIYKLNKSINVGEIVGEFNFFDFEKNKNNRFSKIISPYIFAGVGGLTEMYSRQKRPEICIPFGVGLKWKMADRWNLHAQWSSKLLVNDNLEENIKYDINTELNNFGNLNGVNLFNNDLLTSLIIGISFDIWKKQCDCKNYSNTKKRKKNTKKQTNKH